MEKLFAHTSKDGRVRVIEFGSAYYIELLATGEVRAMGDGVDMYPNDWQFSKAAQFRIDLDVNTDDFIDAYFG